MMNEKELHILDHSKFERAFGSHATPLGEAIQQTLAWYHGNPQE